MRKGSGGARGKGGDGGACDDTAERSGAGRGSVCSIIAGSSKTKGLGAGGGDAGTDGVIPERSGIRIGRVFPVRGCASGGGDGLTGGGTTGLGGCTGADGGGGGAKTTPGAGGRDTSFIRPEIGIPSVRGGFGNEPEAPAFMGSAG